MQKKKILVLSDHALSTSGVGTQARYLLMGLLSTGKYTFRCFGAAVKHENYDTVEVSPDLIIKPIDGFGDRETIRLALAIEKPDALLLFTDPRFFLHIFEMEDEVHQVCPIAYNHLWDNGPWPEYNRVLYESTDLINCINYPTYEMCKERFPERTNYIPHAVPLELFHPYTHAQNVANRMKYIPMRPADTFVGIWVNRNAARKNPGDVLAAWKLFLDQLQTKYGHKNATLLMHTDPLDQEGPNLFSIVDMLGIRDQVVFSKDRVTFQDMASLYNISDFVINRSSAEGFGLSTLEGMMCGKPIIALKTGGLTRQVVDYRDGSQNGIALDPEVRRLVGSQLVPYIYEDHVSNETVAAAFMQMYELGPDGRQQLGEKARQYALSEYRMDRLITEWDRTLTDTIENWRSKHRRWDIHSL
jgi:glycosyltransferase involved in cell wall biosynthesis